MSGARKEPRAVTPAHAKAADLLKNLEEARQAAISTRDSGRPRDEVGMAYRSYWKNISSSIREIERFASDEIIPREYLFALVVVREFTANLGAGIVPPSIEEVRPPHRARIPQRARLRATAVAYFNSAQGDGLLVNGIRFKIDDPKAGQTLSRWFGCTRNAISQWTRSTDLSDYDFPNTTEELRERAEFEGGIFQELIKTGNLRSKSLKNNGR